MKKVDFPTIGDLKQVLSFRIGFGTVSYNQDTCTFHIKEEVCYPDRYGDTEIVNVDIFESDITFLDAYKEWTSFTEAIEELPF
jgi:hypothetical protein